MTPTWVEPIDFGEGSGSEATLTKKGEPAEPYLKGTPIDEDGEYELTVIWYLGPDDSSWQSVQFVIDSELPEPVEVTGVEDGGTYVSAAATWTDELGMTSTATLAKDDGAAETYTSGTPIAMDGSYVLRLTTRKDSNGREVQQVISFTIDSVPPVSADITIVGKSRQLSGETVYYTASPIWADHGGTTSTATLQKGSEAAIPYTRNTLIDQDGDYELTVTTTKLSNRLTSTATQAFKVDGGPQPPVITGIPDGTGTYKSILLGPTQLSWTITGGSVVENVRLSDLNTGEYDDSPSNPKPLNQEGEYQFTVGVRKGSEIANYTFYFIVAAISGVEDGGVYESATPDWFVPEYWSDQFEVEALLSKDGEPAVSHAKNAPITAPGVYDLTVTWSNDAGESASKSVSFTIDPMLGGPILMGFSHNAVISVGDEIAWEPREGTEFVAFGITNLDPNVRVTTNNPMTIDKGGEYRLYVRVKDGDQESLYTYEFIAAEISGVEEGSVYSGGPYSRVEAKWVRPGVFGEVNVELRKGDSPIPYSYGNTIEELGEYELTVTWRARTGTPVSKSVHFTLVPPPPAPQLTGVSHNAILLNPTEISWTPSTGTEIPDAVLVRKNDNMHYYFLSNNSTTLNEAGEYELTVYVRQDGLKGEHHYQFMLVEILGVEEDGVYASVTPEWYEPEFFGGVEAELTKDGSPIQYSMGETIEDPGEYTLTVTWRTDAGNSESKSVSFTIIGVAPVAPVIDLEGEPNGNPNGSIYKSVTATWTDAEGTTSTATLTRTWNEEEPVTSSYVSETLIDEEGDYVLTVTTTKTSNGLTATTTVNFKVTTQVP